MSARRPMTREKTILPQIGRDEMLFTPTLVSELTEIFPLIGLNRIDIRFSQKKIERSGHQFTIIKKRVEPITDDRAMDSSSDGFDLPEDAIDKVAKANSVKTESAQILPEVRASPCAIHFKKDKRNDLLFHSNYHAGQHSPSTVRKTKLLKDGKLENPERRQPPPLLNTLPRGMPSKEFVMTWLMHGSEPSGKSHFPDIVIPDGRPKRSKGRESLRKSTISE
ncbi:uncharacterized protein LOC134255257 [Saccostrea cucullata]|uniref:uncharacterized protein LOC134255257 n=1 Tax=Saccostrea cuccullata TaxID=36930 RepID=UPI002ED1DFBB